MTHARNIAMAAFTLRLSLAVMLLAHGLLKVLVYTLPGSAQFFASVGYPGWLAYIVAGMELIGGALMLFGIATRTTALAMIPIMLGAVLVHWQNGWVFSAPNGGWEYPALLVVLMLVQALLGPGAYALIEGRRTDRIDHAEIGRKESYV